ncbi:hypothetical protein [Paenibacillus aquistagni]|uniref:Uncharacterized protein n=1 Tax=Paenibacillus aquistagni TaxID=1852522 RepID=A0A1X7LWL1_9BACL|nr:hypothetical protein [Paenibacillus aquistagni]SMG57509.1 hypothetical protein SAMN06295960_4451 [Paenibacillus aquistagni]
MKKRMIQGAVLSALLLTAVAAPAYASPKEEATSDSKAALHVKISKTEAAAASFFPLEIAKKYAPEMVKDWEEVLKNMNVSMTVHVQSASPVEAGEYQQLETKAIEDGDIDMDKLKEAHQGEGKVDGIFVMKKVTEANDKSEYVEMEKIIDSEAAMDPQTSALMGAHKELHEAVASEDKNAIKASLAQLLKLYQDQNQKEQAAN